MIIVGSSIAYNTESLQELLRIEVSQMDFYPKRIEFVCDSYVGFRARDGRASLIVLGDHRICSGLNVDGIEYQLVNNALPTLIYSIRSTFTSQLFLVYISATTKLYSYLMFGANAGTAKIC